jgi:membrane associated rhomboid family serine protease
MIPLGDADRRPVLFPSVTSLIIVANVLVFLLELTGGDAFISRWALIPAEIVAGRRWITILTAMFMHAGWAHILSNMLFFWVFGPEIEDVMGPVRYLVFYLLGGLAATVAQVVIAPGSTVPNLGASGAIAAVMGAFLITYPRDRIRTVLLLGWFARVTFIPAIVLVGFWCPGADTKRRGGLHGPHRRVPVWGSRRATLRDPAAAGPARPGAMR